MLPSPVSAEEPFRMNERIHGERAASERQDRVSELQNRVTELIEQTDSHLGSAARNCGARRTTCSPSSMPSSTAPDVSAEQTQAAYVSPKKAASSRGGARGPLFG